MKKLSLLLMLVLSGCNSSSGGGGSVSEPVVPSTADIELTPQLIDQLKSQPTIDDQLGILYDKFEPLLDRSDSLVGVDANEDGIRDDIEAFIDALQISEPERRAIKQNARYSQEILSHDYSEKTRENKRKAYEIARKYDIVIACKDYVGIPLDDAINTSRTITALTYNTKSRTMAYLTYNKVLSGLAFTSLDSEAKHCE
ncbi:chromosome partitioning protein ParA [Vibrio sp. MarTm2]|uniref:chromosome partitioning protein ParA n=1 Tax=Vibrio sp. MarTm2 TaxID=2998831 RepID=UPI0022CD313F|nr:chromosome partitioning protein ParA [Vibrio sp. MarTm2]MDA0128505.1 chromosome partitioning protein ParA [Vibrio sp. MarTm2]